MLVLLFALITFHSIYETTWKEETTYTKIDTSGRPVKIYSVERTPDTILNFLGDLKLPEETAVLIYIGYFIIATRIVLLAQIVKKDSSDK